MLSLYRLLVGVMLFSPGLAAAQCDESSNSDDLLGWMSQIEEALRGGDEATAGRVAMVAEKKLPCLSERLPSQLAPRLYRAIGAGVYVAGSTARGKQWMLTSAEMDSMFEYGIGDLPPGHELVDVWLDQIDLTGESRKTVPGKHFVEGVVYLDGSTLKLPMAHEARLHLIQLEIDGEFKGWVFEGTDFPVEVFGAGGGEVASKDKGGKSKSKTEKGKTAKAAKPEKTAKVKPVKSTPQVNNWPAERVVLLAGGGATIIGSGVLYALSGVAKKNAQESRYKSDLDDYIRQNRTLFISSAAVGAAGIGSVSFGMLFFVIDGQPVTGFNVRF